MAQAIFFLQQNFSDFTLCLQNIKSNFFFNFNLLALKSILNNLLFFLYTIQLFVIYSPFPWVHCNALLLDVPITWQNLSHFI